MGRKTAASTQARTHISTYNGRTVEISDADFNSLAKTGKANVTDLRTGEVVTAEVTHWKLLVEDCDREAYRSMTTGESKVENRKPLIRPPLPQGVVRASNMKKKMTVGDLIRELQVFPADELVLISKDGEGNRFKHPCDLSGSTFGENDAEDFPFEGIDLKVGDPYVVIWPHG